jgi:hypothetical protein
MYLCKKGCNKNDILKLKVQYTSVKYRCESADRRNHQIEKMLDDNTKRGFEMMNAALKKEAEA